MEIDFSATNLQTVLSCLLSFCLIAEMVLSNINAVANSKCNEGLLTISAAALTNSPDYSQIVNQYINVDFNNQKEKNSLQSFHEL